MISIVRLYSRLRSQSNYEKSNAITLVSFEVSCRAKMLAGKLLTSFTPLRREVVGSALLAELGKDAGISSEVKLKVSATRQYHKRKYGRTVWKQYGYYRPRSQYIYIQNKTAVRAKTLAPKTFLTTLLHEWMHHYDYAKLNIRSIHTKGFYQRISSLREKLSI